MVGVVIHTEDLLMDIRGVIWVVVVLVVHPVPFVAHGERKKFVGILYIIVDEGGNMTVEGKILKDPLRSKSMEAIIKSAR
jgi:hypothetical protein